VGLENWMNPKEERIQTATSGDEPLLNPVCAVLLDKT